MRFLVKMMLAIFACMLLSLSIGTPAYGLGKFTESTVTGYMQVDPILAHDNPVSAHKHLFLGNATLLKLQYPESATYTDLVGQATLSDNPDDTAAYWIPDLVRSDGVSVPFRKFFAYYRGWDNKNVGSVDTQAYPPDLRLVTGDATGLAPAPLNKNNWSCDERSDRPGPYPTIEAAQCNLATGTVFLTLHITFESCWNGSLNDHNVAGNTADNDSLGNGNVNNLRYPTKGSCPTGYPIKLPELRETIKWDYQGDGSDIALTSDLMQREMGNNVKAGQTLHADFWNTWVQSGGVHNGLEGMVASCIRAVEPQDWCNA